MSNKKLNENKQMLNESWSELFREVLPVFTIGLLAAIRVGFGLLYNTNKKSSMLSTAVYDSLDEIYKDKDFVRDFVDILKQEGNLEDIIATARDKHNDYPWEDRYSTKRNSGDDRRFYNSLMYGQIKQGSSEYNWVADGKRIVDKVMITRGYKNFSKKHKFTPNDDKAMRGLFYYMITRPDFAVNVKKYLYTAVEKNKPVVIRAIDKSDMDTPPAHS
jgi:hypothetical protein